MKLADSTLYKMKKREIIELLRCAEHNVDAYKATLEQHITNVKDWVPVVRCKDCKNFCNNPQWFDYDFCRIHYYTDGTPMEVFASEFCSRGERVIDGD